MENANYLNRPGIRPSILFVCTANMCRSPMAEGLFKAHIKKNIANWQSWRVESVGTWTKEGRPAVANTVKVIAERGIDISDHKTRPITHLPLSRFRLILTMEAGHKEAIQIEFPDIASRTYMLSEMIDRKMNIKDPIGKPVEEFEKTAKVIEMILEKGFDRILSLIM